MGYTSSGATAMQYELHMAVSGSSISTSTGTVTSFNGRSGTVTPTTNDYTATQISYTTGTGALNNSDQLNLTYMGALI